MLRDSEEKVLKSHASVMLARKIVLLLIAYCIIIALNHNRHIFVYRFSNSVTNSSASLARLPKRFAGKGSKLLPWVITQALRS